MAENKTKPTGASVSRYLSAIEHEGRRNDCETTAALMSNVTRAEPKMWGPSIVGFDSYHYKYDRGHQGDSCVTGFSSRKNEIVVYLVASGPNQDTLLGKLGRQKMGKSCLYIRKLADVDMRVLEQLVTESVAEVRRRYGTSLGGA